MHYAPDREVRAHVCAHVPFYIRGYIERREIDQRAAFDSTKLYETHLQRIVLLPDEITPY